MNLVQDTVGKHKTVKKEAIKNITRVCARKHLTDDSVMKNDGGNETSIVNNNEDGGSEASYNENLGDDNTEERSGDDDTSKVQVGSLLRKFFPQIG